MQAVEFARLQASMRKTNVALARDLKKCPQSVSNYRSGRQVIPAHVAAMMHLLMERPPE